jgi:tRNA(Phe) wybutosine-synthesizing methylase Tyw3
MVDLCNFENRLDQWLFRFHREIEQVFNELKRNELEQPRWYAFHRYVLHVLCSVLMHNFEFLLWSCNTIFKNRVLENLPL